MSDGRPLSMRLPVAGIRRKPIDLAEIAHADTRPLISGSLFPLLVTPRLPRAGLAEWAARNADWIEARLLEHGALLFRNYAVSALEDFERFVRTLYPSLVEYKDRSTPRTSVGRDLYTSTEYPAHLDIVQHNENSYAPAWPRKLAFYCHQPAERGGETPLADSRDVYRHVSPATRDLFAGRGVMYVRNYRQGVDLSWQEAFQTSDPADVERYCRSRSIAWEWLDEGRRLRTRQVRPALARHPATRDPLWFNQAHLFHVSGLDRATREALQAEYAEADLPRQTFFGDGSPIPLALVDEIRAAYAKAVRVFAWQAGDVLLLDNMMTSHGRRAFTGTRRVYVAMAEPWDRVE